MAASSKKDDGQYFRLPKMPWLVLVPSGAVILTASALKPDLIPIDYLGPLKNSVQNVLDNHHSLVQKSFVVTVVLHSLEAVYATYFASKNNLSFGVSLAWGAQALIYGLFSVIPLRRHFKARNKKP